MRKTMEKWVLGQFRKHELDYCKFLTQQGNWQGGSDKLLCNNSISSLDNGVCGYRLFEILSGDVETAGPFNYFMKQIWNCDGEAGLTSEKQLRIFH